MSANDPESPGNAVKSFKPISHATAHTLILGTMPGVASLRAARYYAHPRNAFWPILRGICKGEPARFNMDEAWPYAEQVRLLRPLGLALWDVLAQCERRGSLDSAIVRATVETNDLAGFIVNHPQLDMLVFNGQGAERLYVRHCAASVYETQRALGRRIVTVTMPSTSPAMASMTLAQKCERWRTALNRESRS